MQTDQASAEAKSVVSAWLERPIPQVLDHILDAYHGPLRVELARVGRLIHQALDAQLSENQKMMEQLGHYFSALCDELELHMGKEEKVLFPWLRSGRGASAKAPIKVMQREHRQTEELLAQLRACWSLIASSDPVIQAIVQGLAAIDEALQQHIELEEHLFHRALSGE